MPININDLWIGDQLQIVSTGQIGRFHGKEEGRVRVKIQEQIVLAEIHDVMIYEEAKVEQALVFDDDDRNQPREIESSIDLHIELLAPQMRSQTPGIIRDYQLRRAKEYLQIAIESKKSIVTIIHGKGAGVLKSEIQHLLKQTPEVRFSFDRNKGGATEVWL